MVVYIVCADCASTLANADPSWVDSTSHPDLFASRIESFCESVGFLAYSGPIEAGDLQSCECCKREFNSDLGMRSEFAIFEQV